jgi:hypothetical protein
MQGDDSRRARVSTLPNHRTRDPNQTQILRATCGRADENGCNRYRYLGGLRELRTQSFSRTTRKIGEPSQEIHFVTGSSRICSGASKAMTYWQVNRLSISAVRHGGANGRAVCFVSLIQIIHFCTPVLTLVSLQVFAPAPARILLLPLLTSALITTTPISQPPSTFICPKTHNRHRLIFNSSIESLLFPRRISTWLLRSDR